jgi:hypothetical protein
MRISIAVVTLATTLAHAAIAQSAQPTAPQDVAGVWRGTSVCLVHPSPCHDEIVVYRIASMPGSDSLALDARKMVGDQEQSMGVLACHLSLRGQLTCAIPRGIWRFSVRNDSLTGELRLLDDTRFREVRAARAP